MRGLASVADMGISGDMISLRPLKWGLLAACCLPVVSGRAAELDNDYGFFDEPNEIGIGIRAFNDDEGAVYDRALLDMGMAQALYYGGVVDPAAYGNSYAVFLQSMMPRLPVGEGNPAVDDGWSSEMLPSGIAEITHVDGRPEYGDYILWVDETVGTYIMALSFWFQKSVLDTHDAAGTRYDPGNPGLVRDGEADWTLKYGDDLTAEELARPGTVLFTPEFTAFSADGLSQWSTSGFTMAFVPLFDVTNEPTISLARIGEVLRIGFSGTVQESPDMQTWTTMDPQPASPFEVTLPPGEKRFFRLEEAAPAATTVKAGEPSAKAAQMRSVKPALRR